MKYHKKTTFSLFLFYLLTINSLFAISRIDISPFSIDMSYTPKITSSSSQGNSPFLSKQSTSSEDADTINDRPFNITVSNDLKSYQLAVSKQDLTMNEDISLVLNYSENISLRGNAGGMNGQEIWHISSPFEIDDIETTVYEHTSPEYEINQFAFYLSAEIPENIKAGTYSFVLRFFLYEENIPVDEAELNVNITVNSVIKMEVFFIDSSLKGLDFGVINNDIKRIDKEIQVQITSNLSKSFRLLQRRDTEMKSNSSNIPFYEKGIYFELKEDELKGKAYHDSASPLTDKDDLIYESDVEGTSDLIPIIYSLQNSDLLKAGRYESHLSYFIEPDVPDSSFPVLLLTFDLILEIEKYFEFKITPEHDDVALDFTPRMLEQLKNDRLLKIEIISNTGKSFSFNQSLPNGLLNPDGGKLENNNIKWVLCDEKGVPLVNEVFEEITSNEQTVFESNEQGDSETFYLRYQVDYDRYQMAGLYRSDINYTLSDD